MDEIEPDGDAPYTDATLARLAVAAAAYDLAEYARGFVPIRPGSLRTTGGGGSQGAELEDAARLITMAERVVELLVVFESVAGTTWEDIGSGMSMAKQNAHRKFAGEVDRFKEALAEPEVTDPDTGVTYSRLPDGADMPDRWGDRLDQWVVQHRQHGDLDHGDRPVSGGLARMHPQIEMAQLTIERHALLQRHLVPPAEDMLRIARRELQLWEHLATEDPRWAESAAEAAARTRDYIAQLAADHPR